MKVIEIAEKYKNAPETTEKIMKYIDDPDNFPAGNYQGVVSIFQRKGISNRIADENVKFYQWVENNYKDIVVFKPLLDELGEDGLKEFIFDFGGLKNPYYNQKWHFYVSYLAFKEYWTIIGVPKGFDRDEEENMILKRLYFNCPELNMWIDDVLQIARSDRQPQCEEECK